MRSMRKPAARQIFAAFVGMLMRRRGRCGGRRGVAIMGRMVRYPAIFVVGWLFNLIYDTQFVLGFLAGWLTHSWVGGLIP